MNESKTDNTSRISMQPVEKKSLYLKISDSIYSYIQMNGLQPGDKLPSEREMSSMLGTSRNSVREALRILEDRGLIYVKTGSGVFIQNPYGENNSFTVRLTNFTLHELQELQNTLDHQAVENAMERATDEEKQQLISLASEMVRLASDNLYSHILDHSFHSKLYEIGRNSVIHQLIVHIREYRFVQQEESEDGNDSIWLPTVFQHLELAQALYDKNLKKAIKAIDEINEYGFQISHEK
ncbi:MAG TPA: GntR family transcriptional regulator [Candidatus Mediterraneibacter faecavium]|uniref:GntR family transcriptional regulator n=2 Tax=Mediterraneibacter TaxID=2316020 RepID=A0A9D2TM87_9FIRM|nr:GntR family transcriptional regulator [Candidatus Mediterraneibacter faecipullorum]HJC73933.1 GntR family transcriptional regulator [Candidatus Mediterraneibacter faecavium]